MRMAPATTEISGPSGAIRNLEGDPRHKGCLFKMHLCRTAFRGSEKDRPMAGPGGRLLVTGNSLSVGDHRRFTAYGRP
jgi:hypothetical protein